MIDDSLPADSSVALVTYLGSPDFSASDRLLVAPLLAHGLAALAVPWDQPEIDWTRFAAVVLRSCWDYHLRPAEFRAWIRRLHGQSVNLHNPASLVLWNIDKIYLRALEQGGAVVVPTVWIDQGAEADLGAIMRDQNWADVVVKPRIGASAYSAWKVQESEAAARQEEFAALLATGGLLVQRFLPQIAAGEWSLIFFEGEYSHAVLKKPAPDNIFVQRRLGGTWQAETPPAELIAQARRVLDLAMELAGLPGTTPLYARVDGLDVAGQLTLMELEVNEPGLLLDAHQPAGADRFAAAIANVATR